MPPGGKRADDATNEPPSPYPVVFSRQARRNLHEDLPLEVAIAATETIQHAIAVNPHRVGKPLDKPFDGFQSARRGTYRIIYRINEAKRVVEIHSIRHRRDAYRS
jgi:mRNA interferase RelE/StbE